MVDGNLLRELDANGQLTAGGMRLVSAALSDGTPVQIDLKGDRLLALELASPFRAFEREALQGMTIVLVHDDSERFELVIDKVHVQSLQFWEGDADVVEAYDIKARRVEPPPGDKESAFICLGDGLESDPRWAGIAHAAIAFEGDHFDFENDTISPPQSPSLFNLACAGGRMAKMHLSRHTQASNHDGRFATTLDQRMAMLRMFAADYCATGQPFAGDDDPVTWLDNTGWAQPALDLDPSAGQVTSIEAIWGPDGAVCLDTPRVRPRDDIPCALPACKDITSWQSQGHVISANPAPPSP